MTTPRISVLIGTWNNASTLQRAIDSIVNQTIEDFELIVVDDGSTDETPHIVARVTDPRVRHLRLEHMGIPKSLNKGLLAARAPIVAIQDADDWSLPERLARQLEVLDANENVAVVGCWMQEVDEHGEPLTPRQPRVAGDMRRILHRYNPIPNTAAAFRREVGLAVGGFDSRFRYAMDYDLWQRIAEQHDVVCIGEVLAVRQLTRTNAGARFERSQLRETMRIRMEGIKRSRRLRNVTGLAKPALSFVLPLPVKRAIRRARGQAA